eukprot:767548-Hanusia_phi.AAC.14
MSCGNSWRAREVTWREASVRGAVANSQTRHRHKKLHASKKEARKTSSGPIIANLLPGQHPPCRTKGCIIPHLDHHGIRRLMPQHCEVYYSTKKGLGEGRGSKRSYTEPRLPPENTGRQLAKRGTLTTYHAAGAEGPTRKWRS